MLDLSLPPITSEYLVARPENPRTASKVETGREMPALFLKAYCTRGSLVRNPVSELKSTTAGRCCGFQENGRSWGNTSRFWLIFGWDWSPKREREEMSTLAYKRPKW